jgi:hypothetical protein
MQSLSSYLPLGAKRPLAHAASRVRSTQDVQDLPYRVHPDPADMGRPLHTGAVCPAIACHGTFGVALAIGVAAMLTGGSRRNSSNPYDGREEASWNR